MVWRRFFERNTVTGVGARAGFLDRPVLAVLIISLSLVGAVFGAMLIGIL